MTATIDKPRRTAALDPTPATNQQTGATLFAGCFAVILRDTTGGPSAAMAVLQDFATLDAPRQDVHAVAFTDAGGFGRPANDTKPLVAALAGPLDHDGLLAALVEFTGATAAGLFTLGRRTPRSSVDAIVGRMRQHGIAGLLDLLHIGPATTHFTTSVVLHRQTWRPGPSYSGANDATAIELPGLVASPVVITANPND